MISNAQKLIDEISDWEDQRGYGHLVSHNFMLDKLDRIRDIVREMQDNGGFTND